MGKKVDPNLRISQRGVGLHKYQWEFIDSTRDFSLDVWVREKLNEQIKILKPEMFYDKETMSFPEEENE